jgi:hypothetical protein
MIIKRLPSWQTEGPSPIPYAGTLCASLSGKLETFPLIAIYHMTFAKWRERIEIPLCSWVKHGFLFALCQGTQ